MQNFYLFISMLTYIKEGMMETACNRMYYLLIVFIVMGT